MFEKQKETTGEQVDRMLDRLKGRIDAGKLEKDEAQKAVSRVADGIVKAKELLDKDFNFETASAADIANLSNAWKAWQETGVFKGDVAGNLKSGLKELLKETGAINKFARQMWRTEMVGYIIEKMRASQRADRAEIIERVMASQIVGEKEDEPIEALTLAMWLDPRIRDRAAR